MNFEEIVNLVRDDFHPRSALEWLKGSFLIFPHLIDVARGSSLLKQRDLSRGALAYTPCDGLPGHPASGPDDGHVTTPRRRLSSTCVASGGSVQHPSRGHEPGDAGPGGAGQTTVTERPPQHRTACSLGAGASTLKDLAYGMPGRLSQACPAPRFTFTSAAPRPFRRQCGGIG